MALAVAYALVGYLIIFYAVPTVLETYGLASYAHGVTRGEPLYSAVAIVVLEAVSALFSNTRLRGVFMVGLGLLAYLFISTAFPSGTIEVNLRGATIILNIGFVVALTKLLCLLEAAGGCVAMMADNLQAFK
jgi:hypothetical protein